MGFENDLMWLLPIRRTLAAQRSSFGFAVRAIHRLSERPRAG